MKKPPEGGSLGGRSRKLLGVELSGLVTLWRCGVVLDTVVLDILTLLPLRVDEEAHDQQGRENLVFDCHGLEAAHDAIHNKAGKFAPYPDEGGGSREDGDRHVNHDHGRSETHRNRNHLPCFTVDEEVAVSVTLSRVTHGASWLKLRFIIARVDSCVKLY